ncbi:MAG: preprotein translocase subunit SecG [Polyangiaceae bacterium]
MLKFLETPLTVVHVFACILLILVILVQPGKSGGLGAAFGGAGAQQVFGGRGAGNLLSRVTWITMAVFFGTSISLAYMSSSGDTALEKEVKKDTDPAAASAAAGSDEKPKEEEKPEPEEAPAPTPAETAPAAPEEGAAPEGSAAPEAPAPAESAAAPAPSADKKKPKAPKAPAPKAPAAPAAPAPADPGAN